MKKNDNKKVVNAVKNFVAGAVKKQEILEKNGKKIMKKVEKEWKSTKGEREKISKVIGKVAKGAEKKVNKVAKDANSLKKDIIKGYKQGIKVAKKK